MRLRVRHHATAHHAEIEAFVIFDKSVAAPSANSLPMTAQQPVSRRFFRYISDPAKRAWPTRNGSAAASRKTLPSI
jgi:hypothetical protein